MFYVYLLQSQSNPKKLYVGYTSFLEDRLEQHNTAESGYTSRFQPWGIIYYEAYGKRAAAIERERQFKRHANVMIRLKSRLGLQ
ncbi:MAG: GIY-YIG nuclease family protein [Patescibacteria group bacterium]